MKLLFCLNRDIYCLSALNYLLPYVKNHQIILYFSNRVGKPPSNTNIKNLQSHEKDLSIDNLQSLTKKSDIKTNLKNFLTFEEIEQKFKIFDFDNINQDGFKYLSTNWCPDLIISIRFGQIFKEKVISLPKFGIINLHSGILPNYRGILATFWAMLNSENEIGTTLHFVNNESIDTGNVISIAKNKVNYDQSLMVNIFKLYPSGIMSVVEFIDKINRNLKIKSLKQDKLIGKYYSYPKCDVVKKFLDLGLLLN